MPFEWPEMTKREDPDRAAPSLEQSDLGLVCVLMPLCLNTKDFMVHQSNV